MNLLNGSLNTSTGLSTNDTVAAKASGSLGFVSNIGAGQTLRLNGVTLTEGVDFNRGGTVTQTLDNLTNSLNNDARFTGYNFSRGGNNVLKIDAEVGGSKGNQFTIDQAGSTSGANFFVYGNALTGAGVFSLDGGSDAGLAAGDTKVSGSINNSLLTSGTGTAASTQAIFNTSSDIQAGNTISIANGEGGNTVFTFVNGAPASANQIQIGSTLEETLGNAANAINNYTGADDYGVRQLNATVNGNTLQISNNTVGNPTAVNGATPLTVALGTAGGSLSTGTLNNGTTGGVDVTGVTNAAFTGNIQGFTANFNGADNVTASVTVGGETYTAQITDTTPNGNTRVRFSSQDGGYFDVTLQGNQGQSVADQAGANSFADRLNAAFSGLNFSQNREIENFGTSGQLVGASLSIQGTDFNNLRASDVKVSSGIGGNASVEIKINGETYRTGGGLGTQIGAKESITLTSVNDPNKTVTFTNGNTAINLNTQQGAANFEKDLKTNLGVPGGQGAVFQTGENSDDTVNISIGDLSTKTLFGGKNVNLLSASAAADASLSVRSAQDYVTSQRANVGAYQNSLEYTQSYLDTSILNQEAARSVLQDTDFAAESTNNANLQVKNKQGIATLVQSNRLQGNILRLLGE
ncbi:MAG: flagellin [Rickettsiales bacterium]